MGRVKLKIKRLESTSNQQVTYSRRRNGILKKAKELFILCDIDIVLLMFSPTGKSTLFHRERRKLESLEAPKKTFKKLDHDVNIQGFLGSRFELSNQLRMMLAQRTEAHKRLRCYDQAFGSNRICYQIGYGELKLKDGRVTYTPHEDRGQGEDEGHEEELGRDEDDDDEGDEEESGIEDAEDGDEFCKEP
ncbi:hypothetical protein ACSBR1_004646 [Camellia fascicularis]